MKIVITAVGRGGNMKRFSATAFASALSLSLGVTLSGCGYIYRTLPDGYYPVSTETKIRPTDKYGNVLLYKDYWTVEEGGTIVSTDKFGNKQHHKQQYASVRAGCTRPRTAASSTTSRRTSLRRTGALSRWTRTETSSCTSAVQGKGEGLRDRRVRTRPTAEVHHQERTAT